MFARLCLWYLRNFTWILDEAHDKAWKSGVAQQRHEPESTLHYSEFESGHYWFGPDWEAEE